MRQSKVRKAYMRGMVESMNKTKPDAKALIEVMEQITGQPYHGTGINSWTKEAPTPIKDKFEGAAVIASPMIGTIIQ